MLQDFLLVLVLNGLPCDGMGEFADLLGFVASIPLQAQFAAEGLFESVGKDIAIFDSFFRMEEAELSVIGGFLTSFFLLLLIRLVFGRFSPGVISRCRQFRSSPFNWFQTLDDSLSKQRDIRRDRVFSSVLFYLC